MKTLSAGATAAQAVRSPRWRVSCTVAARGLNPDLPALTWSDLTEESLASPGYAVTAFDLAAGGIVRIRSVYGYGIQQQTVADPANPADWFGGWSTISASAPLSLAAYRHGANAARLYYPLSGNVYFLRTTDNGATWLGPLSIYTGGDASKDIAVGYAPVGHAMTGYVIGFSTYDSGAGAYAAYFNAGSNVKYADGWRAAGVYIDPDDAAYVYPLVFRQSDEGTSRLRVLRFNGSVFDQPQDIDQTQSGLFGLSLALYRFHAIPALPYLLIGTTVETAYTGANYEGIASGFKSDSELVADEPVIWPELGASTDYIRSDIVRDNISGRYYHIGANHVYEGVPQPAPSDTLTPIRYHYNQGLTAGEPSGAIELTFEQDIPALSVGQLLTVRRTVSWGTDSGYADLAFYITAVDRSKRLCTVKGVDPIGLLGIARCRRPSVLNDGSAAGLAAVMRRLCGRFGLPALCDDAGLESDAVMPMTLAPSESLLGAAYRAASQSDVYLIPAGDGTFRVEMINPPASDSGDHDDTPHSYPSGQWELIDAHDLTEYNRLAFAYVLGTYSTDPEDGSYVGMATGPALPNTRPLSYSITNTRYNTDTRVLAAAVREASRQRKLTVDAMIEAPANLALELYDMIEVTEPLLGWTARPFRVRRIRETWDRGLLTHTLWLGDES
jgi:hypothetical protein